MLNEEADKIVEGSQDPQVAPAAPEKPVVPVAEEGKPAAGEAAVETPIAGEDDGKGMPADEKGLLFEVKKLRADRRALRDENERLNARIGEQKPYPENNQGQPEPEQLTVEHTVRNVLEQERIKEHREEAFNHILSQDDVATEADLKSIGEVMCDTGLDTLAKTKPFQAAELALREWRRVREEKRSKASPAEKASAQDMPKGGAKPSGGSSSKKLWSPKEISNMSNEDYEKNRSELLAAGREGRIK